MLNASVFPLLGFVEPNDHFRWQQPNGFTVSVRLEKRGGKKYWYARKWAGGRSYQEYICPHGELDENLLRDAADKVETAVNSHAATTGEPD